MGNLIFCPSDNIECGIVNSKVRLGLFFLFLALIAAQVYVVLHIESKVASHEGFSARIHPIDSKKET